MSGVGISFGADRIYDVLNTLNLYPQETITGTQVLFINFGEDEIAFAQKIAKSLRDAGIHTEVYPDKSKIKKQMSYANAKNISYVVIIGEEELKNGTATIKNMTSGEQKTLSVEKLILEIVNK